LRALHVHVFFNLGLSIIYVLLFFTLTFSGLSLLVFHIMKSIWPEKDSNIVISLEQGANDDATATP